MSIPAPAAPAVVHPELQKLVDEGKVSVVAARALSALEPGAFCQHKSWGFGQVASWNLDNNQILIHFGAKKDHPMQLLYAAETCRPVPADHLLARKSSDLAGTKKLLANDPVGATRLILQHADHHRMTPAQMTALLTPDVLSGEAEFKRWWDNAKKLLKRDGGFVIPAKKTEFVEMREAPVAQTQALVAQFDNARQLKQQISVLDQIYKGIEDFKEEPTRLLPLLESAGKVAVRNQRLDIDAAFEMLVTRDEISSAAGVSLPEGSPTLIDLMRGEENRLGEIIGNLPAVKQRYALHSLPAALGEDRWVQRALSLLPQTHNARVVGEIGRLFEANGKLDEFKGYLDRSIRDYSITCEMLLWLAKERSDGKYNEFATPRLFSAILSALERDSFSDIKRSTKLRDLLISDRELVTELLAAGDKAELRTAARALLATPSLEELDKRSLMARLIKKHPDLHTLLTGGAEEKPVTLVVSWSSLEKRKLELDDLVNKQIPKNIEEISIAREYGDLRENFEFKAAKEMQAVLARRRSELEQDLLRARGTNFENPDTAQVSIGTTVKLKMVDGGKAESYTILGAWDGNPEKHLLSYQTTIGQALLSHRVGEVITLPEETAGSSKRCEILEILPYNKAEAVAKEA